jgi:hypothetical protein
MTRKQAEVVRWLVEHDHDDEPVRAVEAGLCSASTIYNLWGLHSLRKWCAEYRASLPPPPPSEQEIAASISAMVPAALATLTATLAKGKGDRVAVAVAQWVLAESTPKAQKSGRQPKRADTDDEAELANVLRFDRSLG